jgi:transposase
MAIVTVGIDLAKNVFAVHGVDESGKAVLVRPSVARAKLPELIASLPPCLIGMEACSGAHHWAREFAQFDHTVRLMAPKFVVPYRLSGKRGKNDAADAVAICEAVTRPNMRFVPVKTVEQQGQLMVHRDNCVGTAIASDTAVVDFFAQVHRSDRCPLNLRGARRSASSSLARMNPDMPY